VPAPLEPAPDRDAQRVAQRGHHRYGRVVPGPRGCLVRLADAWQVRRGCRGPLLLQAEHPRPRLAGGGHVLSDEVHETLGDRPGGAGVASVFEVKGHLSERDGSCGDVFYLAACAGAQCPLGLSGQGAADGTGAR
jgi:hypothetical protein